MNPEIDPSSTRFNPVLGFLSVSTVFDFEDGHCDRLFQSRAGFSECLDLIRPNPDSSGGRFQSRAGFSECLDRVTVEGFRLLDAVSIPCWVF